MYIFVIFSFRLLRAAKSYTRRFLNVFHTFCFCRVYFFLFSFHVCTFRIYILFLVLVAFIFTSSLFLFLLCFLLFLFLHFSPPSSTLFFSSHFLAPSFCSSLPLSFFYFKSLSFRSFLSLFPSASFIPSSAKLLLSH